MLPVSQLIPEKRTCWTPGALLLTASTVAAVAVAAAPFVLPALGVGVLEGQTAFDLCTSSDATGLAGWSSHLLSYVPYVGPTLAEGGIWNGVAGGAVGITGILASHWMEQAKSTCVQAWGKALRVAALATTALISLPAILPAIAMGVNYLAFLSNGMNSDTTHSIVQFSNEIIGKLGTDGAMSAGSAGGAASSLLASHLLSCGVGSFVAGNAIYHSTHQKHGAMEPEGNAEAQRQVFGAKGYIDREVLRRQYGVTAPAVRMA